MTAIYIVKQVEACCSEQCRKLKRKLRQVIQSNSLVGRAAIIRSHTRVSLPRRRSWGFVTLSCPTGTRDGPIRTSAWEVTRKWHAQNTRDGGSENLPPSRVSGAPRWLRACLRSPEKRDKTLFELSGNRDHFCKRSAPVFGPFSCFPGPREAADRLLAEDNFSDRLTRRMPRRKSKFRFVSSLKFIPSLNKQREYF